MTAPILSMLEKPWPDPQADLVAGLCRASAYPQPPEAIAHLQTHISHVFLAGGFAYKIKKPLTLGFLDYASLAKRHAACREELRINRRLAPVLYLDVVPITGTPAQPLLEGRGDAIEYAVKMRAFAQDDLMDAMLRRGALTSRLVDEVAHDLADFHHSLTPALMSSGHGRAQGVVEPALQNFEQLMPMVREQAVTEALHSLRQWTEDQGRHLQDVFESRRHQGQVRECHGDLHLGNIALYQDKVQMFDAIEFNEALRWIDVMSEVAFLAMDLGCRQRPDFAFRLLNQYLERTGDYAGVAVLRFYLVYRAMVRAKVLMLRALQSDLPPRQRAQMESDCHRHISWALGTARASRPLLIILHGFSGSGKTSRSMTLVEGLGAIRLRSDVERKRMHGIGVLTRPGHGVGQGLYESSASDATYEQLEMLAQPALRAGYPVIVDAAFLMRAQRDRFAQLAQRLDVPFVIADFTAGTEVLRERVAARMALGSDASDADVHVLDHQLLHAEPLSDEELGHVVVFDTERLDKRAVREQAGQLHGAARRWPGATTRFDNP